MPNPMIVAGGLSAASGLAQSRAAKSASGAQAQAAAAGIAEQRRQFDTVRSLLQPFVTGGGNALQGQLGLAGVNGQAAQASAIQGIQNSPQFAAMTQQGEAGILANAAATGGLRGGNVQAALGQFRPQVLSQLIEQQYSRLGGLSAMGQNAAAGVGTAAQAAGQNITNLMQQQGAAVAGGALAQGNAWGNVLGGFGSLVGRQLPTEGPIIPQGETMFGSWGFK